ncbi:uncharacterized protein P884DRAFT_263092 [Thermothelomyces heterothallicus CBS 202.75]|uniref:uncharacterized protein n=1 Tax=Thermothelomyces heterothallicus CBS 202.75 TaxID=1149848 RepID=UPI003742CF63
MDSRIEELEREIRAARAEAEKARAEADKARAEADKARAEDEIRDTTLSEYLEACHNLLYVNFKVEVNEKFTSKGSITIPVARRIPSRLEPWDDFLEEQRTIFGILFSKFPKHTAAFRSLHYLRTRGKVIAARSIGDEEALKLVYHDLVMEPMTLIFERLQDEDGIRAEFDIGAGIAFESRLNALCEANPEYTERPRTPDGMANWFQPNQIICAYRRDGADPNQRTMAFFIEQKAPHKLTMPHLRSGLRAMNILEEVVNRPTSPPQEDEAALFQYHADRLVAAALTQTFDYMIQAGLTYGCLTTGQGFVFLKIDWTDPITLLYHLAEPGPEVDEHRENFLCCTALSQMLAFTILALDSGATGERGQDDRQRAIEKLKTWNVDWESILRSIPPTERIAPPTSPAHRPRTYKGVDRSPYLLRPARSRATGRPGCRPGPAERDRSPESDEEGSEPRMPDTPSPAQPRNAQRALARRPLGNSGNEDSSSIGNSRSSNRRYCTQNCLRGLVAGDVLDEECPNVALHRKTDGDRRHPLDHASWLGLLLEQLRRTLDDGVVPLRKQGARGVLFQVTLLAYGYTFVSKATTARFVRELEHEAQVYECLRPLQGDCVPVFLGAVDLRQVGRRYYYDIGVHLVHMMLVSWGGCSLDEVEVSDMAKVEREVMQAVRALHPLGVAHTDVRDTNILWNAETEQAMVIDFEQAVLSERLWQALGPIAPNKRALGANVDTKTAVAMPKSKKDAIWLHMQQEDILAAKYALYWPSK